MSPVAVGGVVPRRRRVAVGIGVIRIRRVLLISRNAERSPQEEETLKSVTVVMEEDGVMPSGEVTEVLRPELPTTSPVATINVSSRASDVPTAVVSTASATAPMTAAGTATPMTFCESYPAEEQERRAEAAAGRVGQRVRTHVHKKHVIKKKHVKG